MQFILFFLLLLIYIFILQKITWGNESLQDLHVKWKHITQRWLWNNILFFAGDCMSVLFQAHEAISFTWVKSCAEKDTAASASRIERSFSTAEHLKQTVTYSYSFSLPFSLCFTFNFFPQLLPLCFIGWKLLQALKHHIVQLCKGVTFPLLFFICENISWTWVSVDSSLISPIEQYYPLVHSITTETR